MAKKRKRTRGRNASTPAQTGSARGRSRRRLNWPSLVFIGLIVLAAATIAIASALDGDRPDCPAGLVWSDAHGHCH